MEGKMYKVKRTIQFENEDEIEISDIYAFKTKNYIGIYNYMKDNFTVMPNEIDEFYFDNIDQPSDLNELDDIVLRMFNEHIECVYRRCKHKITLMEE